MAASGSSDALTLRMLGMILAPSKCPLANIEGAGSPMDLADRVAEVSPAMVILSHLPPEALAQARYQVRRLRARFAGLPILVGRWGEAGSDAASEGLSGVGATHVAFTLADARDQILARAASAVTATTVDAEDLKPLEHLARVGPRADDPLPGPGGHENGSPKTGLGIVARAAQLKDEGAGSFVNCRKERTVCIASKSEAPG